MGSIVSALTNVPKAMALVVKVINARLIVAFINRHGLLEIFGKQTKNCIDGHRFEHQRKIAQSSCKDNNK
jgi:hypothetical protein